MVLIIPLHIVVLIPVSTPPKLNSEKIRMATEIPQLDILG
jgi:hypothetical protein